jgi:hypothetical protein
MSSLIKDFWSIQLTYTLTMGKLCTFLFGMHYGWKAIKYAYWQFRWQLNKKKGEKTL